MYENYVNYSKQIFYDINSTFYVWYDTWEEVENGTKLYGDKVGWPKMPEEEIPSFSKYIESHSIKGSANRFTKGYLNIFKYYFSISEFTGSDFIFSNFIASFKNKNEESRQNGCF